jgi:hypothetical protein
MRCSFTRAHSNAKPSAATCAHVDVFPTESNRNPDVATGQSVLPSMDSPLFKNHNQKNKSYDTLNARARLHRSLIETTVHQRLTK